MNETQAGGSSGDCSPATPTTPVLLAVSESVRTPGIERSALERLRERTGDVPEIRTLLVAIDMMEFQQRVLDWVQRCFGSSPSANRQERNYRFFEEAAELVQASGMTRQECIDLVNYVYDRPPGDLVQEVGGVMTTLAALCGALGLHMTVCGEMELHSINQRIEAIRAKDANKPRGSSLPGSTPSNDVCSRCGQSQGPGGRYGYCDCPP